MQGGKKKTTKQMPKTSRQKKKKKLENCWGITYFAADKIIVMTADI